jgi:hypothetical protein
MEVFCGYTPAVSPTALKLAHSPANASGHCFGCRHEVIPNVDQYPGDLLVRESGPRMVCNKCCMVGADVRPNWKERNK